ncbi:MAG TPA: ParB/RepB/Spo0J family partition protein [Phycicoccus sp.]|nr:ParB/RepB/Spo0J family partition protein [Phycicoccus sp.]
MSEKRRALGRGLGALIPSGPPSAPSDRPIDVFFSSSPPVSATESPIGESDPHPPTALVRTETSQADPTATEGLPDHQAPQGDGLVEVPGATFAEVPLAAIRPNPRQPRTVFDEDDMAELVHSITEIGVLQPVVLRPLAPDADADADVHYELVMGERRWRASRAAGKDTVPAIIKATDDDDLLRDALLENLHRSQLNPLEEAAAYQQLLDDFSCTQEELATRIGRSRPQVSNTLRLLKLPPLVARRVAAGVLSAGHARALLALSDGAAMERLAQRIVAEGLSVRSTEEIVALGDAQTAPAVRRKPRPGGRRPQLDDLAADLSDRLDTRVAIALGTRKGRVTIDFASVEDLHRILDIMNLREPRGTGL